MFENADTNNTLEIATISKNTTKFLKIFPTIVIVNISPEHKVDKRLTTFHNK